MNISIYGHVDYSMYVKETLFIQNEWVTVERPGFQGKRKDAEIDRWNRTYGENNWRIAWELNNREVLDFEDIFYKIYVPGYVAHFIDHPNEADDITDKYAYGYDKDLVSRIDAFNPNVLYNQPGVINQFHHVAFNIALEWFLNKPFRGMTPLKVREGKADQPVSEWPAGWHWSPGRIATVRADLVPENGITGWWQKGSVEDIYQSCKVLQINYSTGHSVGLSNIFRS